MNDTQTQNLDDVLVGIQARWGQEALRVLADVTPPSDFISTGFPPLDAALGTGGIPQHDLTALYGKPTSGMTTLAYSLMTQAQQNQMVTVYLDAPQTFDPEYATYWGIDMEMLLLIRPETWEHALEMLRDVVNISVAGLLVFDTGIPDLRASNQHRPLADTLQRAGALLPQSTWSVVVLVPVDLPVNVDNGAALRLQLARLDWLFDEDVLRGYRVEITVLKNKFGPIGEPVILDVPLGGQRP